MPVGRRERPGYSGRPSVRIALLSERHQRDAVGPLTDRVSSRANAPVSDQSPTQEHFATVRSADRTDWGSSFGRTVIVVPQSGHRYASQSSRRSRFQSPSIELSWPQSKQNRTVLLSGGRSEVGDVAFITDSWVRVPKTVLDSRTLASRFQARHSLTITICLDSSIEYGPSRARVGAVPRSATVRGDLSRRRNSLPPQ